MRHALLKAAIHSKLRTEKRSKEMRNKKPWAVISFTFMLSSWKEIFSSSKSTLVVFLHSFQYNPG